jgi:F-type H+-transporting ATPase subunit beta
MFKSKKITLRSNQMDNFKLNVELLRKRVPNLTVAAAAAGLRPATVSNLCTGKVPLARAEVRTLVALADLAECSVDELIIRGGELEMLETGIKVIDLFVPLTRGGLVGFVARPGMGQLVVLAEILHRMNLNGSQTVFLKPEDESPGVDDVLHVSKLVCHSAKEALEKISQIRKQNVVLAADRQTVLTGEIYSLLESLREKDITPTTLLVDLRGEAMDEHEPYGPLDTLWQFDAELASRKIFPAINPLHSASVLIEGASVDKTHLLMQQQAKKILRRYRELRFVDLDKMPSLEREIFQRGLRLEAYFSQPFFVAEEFTKLQGESVLLQTVIADVQRILKGELDDTKVESLSYIGKLK